MSEGHHTNIWESDDPLPDEDQFTDTAFEFWSEMAPHLQKHKEGNLQLEDIEPIDVTEEDIERCMDFVLQRRHHETE
jgi:hypothetical protein